MRVGALLFQKIHLCENNRILFSCFPTAYSAFMEVLGKRYLFPQVHLKLFYLGTGNFKWHVF